VSGKLAESDEAALVHFQTFAREMEDLATIEPQNAIFLTDRMLAWNHLGSTLIKLKRFDEAMAQYRKYCESALQLATQDPTNHLWRRERKLGLACLLYGLLLNTPSSKNTISAEAEQAFSDYIELAKADLPKEQSKRELDDAVRVLHMAHLMKTAAQPAIYHLLEDYQRKVIHLEETHKNWEILTKTVLRHAESLKHESVKSDPLKPDLGPARAVFKRWHEDGTIQAREAKASLLALEGGFLARAGLKAEGRQYMEDSRTLREGLLKENSGDSEIRNNLASLYWWLANAHAEAGGLDASTTASHWRSHLTPDEIIQAGIRVGGKLNGIFNSGILPLVREIQNLAEQEKSTAIKEFNAAWTPQNPGK
jgi:hypothetical protein